MAKATLEGVEILRTGTFVDMHGREIVVDQAFLEAVAANFSADDAPQINHDHQKNGPSRGQIANPRVVGDRLVIDEANIPAASLQDYVDGGAWPYRSAELDQINMKLLGVARLGAARPAVKGLRRPQAPHTPQLAFAAPDGEGDFHIFEEVSIMDNVQITELSERLEKLEKRNAELTEQLTAQPGQEALLAAKAENEVLLAENANLKGANEKAARDAKEYKARKDAEAFVVELQEAQSITTAHVERGLAGVIAAIELGATEVEWDGKKVSLAEAVRGALKTYKSVSAPTGRAPEGDVPTEVTLSAGEVKAYDLMYPGQTPAAREAGLKAREATKLELLKMKEAK